MTMTPIPAAEAVGPAYSAEALRGARTQSWRALDAIGAAIRPGMRESEATLLAEAVLADHGMELAWHPLVVRFGTNTLKVFSALNEGDAVLGEDDIFFIDMGPVFDGHEGDVGATFTTGADPEMAACANAAKELFDRVRSVWNGGSVGGAALYAAAATEAERMGWVLNLDIRGHRVSDYPHRALPPAGKLADLASAPGADLWVLEIQIRHPTRAFGAFYEDLLT